MRFCGRYVFDIDTRTQVHVVILARAVIIGTWLWALSTEYSGGSVFVAVLCMALGPELECSVGVRELTSSISYARCLLLGYVRSALRLFMLRKPNATAAPTASSQKWPQLHEQQY